MLLQQKLLFKYINDDNFNMLRCSNIKFKKRDFTVKNNQGYTPLYLSVQKSRIEFVKFLLRQGADPDDKCENGNTALHIAFKNQQKIVSQNFSSFHQSRSSNSCWTTRAKSTSQTWTGSTRSTWPRTPLSKKLIHIFPSGISRIDI